jgi:hypothetical protein
MIRSSFSEDARTRLIRLLGLLGSDFDGERATAGAMANRLVRDLGLTWGDVVVTIEPMRRVDHGPAFAWKTLAEGVLASDFATAWEITFCRSLLSRRRGRLTQRQSETLENIWMQRCASTERRRA